MIQSRVETLYSVGEGLPAFSHLPYGTDGYEALCNWHDLYDLECLIQNEISNLAYALDKYDSPYEPEHKEMCSNMKQIKAYLEQCETAVNTLQNNKEVSK